MRTLPRPLNTAPEAWLPDAWIIEDDYDSEFRYESRPLTCLQGLDPYHRVLYVGTLSKILFPGVRLGYLIVPPDLVEAASVIRSITDRHSSMLDQGVLAAFIREGHLGRHMRRMRTLYKKRRDTAVHALAQSVAEGIVAKHGLRRAFALKLDVASEHMGDAPAYQWSSAEALDWQGPPAVWASWAA